MRAGERIIEEQARSQVRTFFDELRNGTTNYRAIASLGDQVAQEYRGRAVLELLQNAHDVLGHGDGGDRYQVSFALNSSCEQPELLVANSGRPFRRKDFRGICQLAQSPKDPNKSVGNKGLGFRSVLELTTCPEVWSTASAEGEPAFTFGFRPGVLDPIVRVAKALMDGRPAIHPEFGREPVVDWSAKQIEEYRSRISGHGTKSVGEVGKWLSKEVRHLSPYVLPRPLGAPPPQVARLLEDGHVTVIRLPLDGGRTGSAAQAVQSVREQLAGLDEAAMVFLRRLSVLRIAIDGGHTELRRRANSQRSESRPATRYDQVRVSRSASEAGDVTQRSFHVWSRTFGGKNQPAEFDRVAAAVQHLPNRWPEVRKVEVAVAVEESREAPKGVFVIFLPTETKTGLGAHVNAPFYGSLDRKTIDFGDDYNELLLELVTDLVLDAVAELVKCPAEPWRGRVVIDLLARTGGGPGLARSLRERARGREDGPGLEELALILCDGGWRRPSVARTMPNIPADDPFGEIRWREQAGFDVASSALDERREAVEGLLRALDGSPDPTDAEWADTLGQMAEQVRQNYADAQAVQSRPFEAPLDWNLFLESVLAVLPPKLGSEPAKPKVDALADARFLPTEDGRLLSASDAVRIFFQPRSGADDAADFVGSVPDSLKRRIAFIHRDVQTHEEPQRKRTAVHKFLDGRFVRSFRRADLLRRVIVPSLPDLPVAHGSPEAEQCADALAWSLEVIGLEEPEGLLSRIAALPVACTAGWFPIKEALFGPGWAGRSGEYLKTLADALPDGAGADLLRSALLPPGDDRWFSQADHRGAAVGEPRGVELAGRVDQFARAGVVDGLRLKVCEPIRYEMQKHRPTLPGKGPATIWASDWDNWKQAVLSEVKPEHHGPFDYDLRGIKTLAVPELGGLGNSARAALSKLILVSLPRWEKGWDRVTIRKVGGHHFSQQVTSPLKHWLSTTSWLFEDPDSRALREDPKPKPLHQRWFVPESLLRGKGSRFRHLSPLPLPLARRLAQDDDLLQALSTIGLNVYPTEDDSTGPALLEALASVVENGGPMPAGGFDVLLGQVRHAWHHLGENRELPKNFLVRTKPRTLTVRTAENLGDVYLPDEHPPTRSLRERGASILAMRMGEALGWVGDRLHKLGATKASALEDRCLIDGRSDNAPSEGAQTLHEAGLGWLPVVLLALAAYGGRDPRGPATKAWQQAARRLGRARVRLCRSIRVELLDGEKIVAGGNRRAHWLGQPGILLLRREITQHQLWEKIAAASQAILDRQDLLKDLRLVLGSLASNRTSTRPTWSQMADALDRAEIDAEALADIRLRWHDETTMFRDRLRPLAKLLELDDAILDADNNDTAGLASWLVEGLPDHVRDTDPMAVTKLLDAARECHDDAEMGSRAHEIIGEDAQLPKWNDALRTLGGQYEQVENTQSEVQAKRHLHEAAPMLRAFARHVAKADAQVPIEGDQGRLLHQGKLFLNLKRVHERLEESTDWPRRCAEWSGSYWQVPFAAVLGVLREAYKQVPQTVPHLGVLGSARTIEELKLALQQAGTLIDPDPHKVARDNQRRLDRKVNEVRRLYEAWVEKEGREPSSSSRAPDIRLDDSMYLRDWPKAELFELAKRAVGDSGFESAVAGCSTIEAMRKQLGMPVGNGGGTRKIRHPIVEVADEPVPVDGTDENFRGIFERLRKLPKPPTGPDIGRDELTVIDPMPSNGRYPKPLRNGGEIDRPGRKTAHLRNSPHLPEFVGIIGEMQAFRFLEAKFNIDESAWVSEFRTRVVPLLEGEKDGTSDGHGYDFRFSYEGTTWCVEVKATTENGTSFDLPSSELDAASRIAHKKDERWRILRVRQALTARPECDWLPNPFEPGAGERLRLRQGGATVEYALPKDGLADSIN